MWLPFYWTPSPEEREGAGEEAPSEKASLGVKPQEGPHLHAQRSGPLLGEIRGLRSEVSLSISRGGCHPSQPDTGAWLGQGRGEGGWKGELAGLALQEAVCVHPPWRNLP